MKLKPLLIAIVGVLALPVLAQSTLTVVNFGGANGAAQKKAYFEPFEKTGAKVVQVEYNGEQAKIKAMVETKNVTWDVVEVESPDVSRGAMKACSRSSTGPSLATRPTSKKLPCTNAAWAPSSGLPSWPTMPTSSRWRL